MIAGIPVSLKGFCTFTAKTVKARKYNDFETKEERFVGERILPKANFSNVLTKKITEKVKFGETHITKISVEDNKTQKTEININEFDNQDESDIMFIEDIENYEEKLRLLNDI